MVAPKGQGGGTYVHHETRLLACVKTADLLTTAQFFGHDVREKRFIAHVTMVFSTAWSGDTDMNRQ